MSDVKLCMSCMSKVPSDAERCPYCEYDGSQENDSYALPIGARVGERYVLGRTLDCDGETITYVGFDLVKRSRVMVREYMPVHGSMRDPETGAVTPKTGAEIHYKTGLSDFGDMFAALKELSGAKGLIATTDLVSKGNTMYAVQEFFAGVTFTNFVKRNEDNLTAERCVELLSPVFDALLTVHNRNMLHGGICPNTIKLNREGEVKIGGFTTVSTRTAGSEYEPRLNAGFTSPEQYVGNSFLTPAADVYAMAATIYYAITGKVPPSAEQRKKFDTLQSAMEINPDIPEHVSRALNLAMVLNPKERTQTLLELKGNILDSIDYVVPVYDNPAEEKQDSLPEHEPEAEQEQETDDAAPAIPRRWKILPVIAAGTCLVMAIVYFSWQFILYKRNVAEEEGQQEQAKDTVRDFIGKNLDEITFDGDYKYQISYTYSTKYEAGMIAAQSPSANSEHEKGGKVTLKISKGKHEVEVPDLTYYEEHNAASTLDELELTYTIEYEVAAGEIPGTVIRQNVMGGTKVDADSTEIILYVARAQ